MKRILTILLMLAMMFFGGRGTLFYAGAAIPTPGPATPTVVSIRVENRSNRNSIGSINQRSRGYDIVIEVKWEKDIAEAYLSNASPFVPRERGASMQAEVTENPDTGNPVIRFEDIAWDGSSNRLLYTVFYDDGEKTDYELAIHQAVALRESEDPSAPSPGESSSRPFWERVSAADRRGTELSSITKDTEPFTLSITYVDEGLNGLYFTGNDVSRFRVYLTGGGFAARGSNRGSITRLPSSSSEPPRFRVDFRDVIWLGESNQIIFRVIYNIEDFTIDENVTATAYQAREEKSEDETKPPSPLTPYIIITDFSAGEGLIEPGQSFELSLKFRNTSTQIPLENIVMTIDPGAGFSLASGSAAHFITGLAAGAEREQVIGLEAKPEAAAGSHPIAVKFSYQYFVQTAGDAPPELVSLESPGAVALVISQVDRFSAEPIEESPYGRIGETTYIPVTITNQGEAATRNINAKVTGSLEILSPSEWYGNLPAGERDVLDVPVIPQESGELVGEVVIQYEDDNRNRKEITVSFTMFVEAPYVPQTPDQDFVDPGFQEPQNGGGAVRTALSITGALMMAAPIAMYLMKRVKAKAEEEIDDDF